MALILGVIFIYYRRFRVLVPMAVTLVAGLSFTFGLTRLAIGHLNIITGFLVSIIAGNGINFGILYVARFLEERRHGSDLPTAITKTHLATWVGTLTAALAAAAAYGSLAVTQFHGFKHFAFIGTFGMLLCWLATYLLTPPVLILQDRRWPIHRAGTSNNWFQRWRQRNAAYERPFVYLVERAPRATALVSLAIAAAGAVAFVIWLRNDPIDYNMRHMQNDLGAGKEVYRVAAKAGSVLGNNTESGMVILANSVEEVPDLVNALEARRDAAPPDLRPFQGVHTLQDFVPPDQAAKIPILESVRRKLLKARRQGGITDADWTNIEPLLPPPDLQPYGLADLPEDLARPFSEVDGTRGRLVFITPTDGKDDNDLHYLLRWADSFRETRLPNGDVIHGSGRAVIFADILDAVLKDIPKASAVSLSLTILTVILAFGRGRAALEVVGSLGVGALLAGPVARAGEDQDQLLQLRGHPDHLRDRRRLRGERDAAGGQWRWGVAGAPPHRRGGGAVQPDHDPGVPGPARLGEPGGALAGAGGGAGGDLLSLLGDALPPRMAELARAGEARAAGAAAVGRRPRGTGGMSRRTRVLALLLAAAAVVGCANLFAPGAPSGFDGWFHLERPDRATNIRFAQGGVFELRDLGCTEPTSLDSHLG